ncbi:MAG: hypothetical protein KAX64_06535 [Chromatiaceae bacterium]|nr:hypothetical protein [Chromatiaceae bacterium]
MPEPRIDRGRVLAAFEALPPHSAITTLGIAWLLRCPEHRVRAAVSWLVLGGVLEVAGEWRRKNLRGEYYGAALYRWNGEREIKRVAQDPRARRLDREQDVQAMAASWLSRKW